MNPKKHVWHLAAVFILFCFCPLQSVFAADLPPDMQRIVNRGTLTVALRHDDIPPVFMQDAAGHLSGYDVALARHLAEQLGVKVVFNRQAATFDGLVDLVAAGKADVAISLLSRTLPRAMRVSFTQPYLHIPKTLLVNRLQVAQLHWEDKVPQMLHSNNTLSIGVLANSSYVSYAKNDYPSAKIVLYTNIEQGMADVEAGKIFAVLYDNIQVQNWLANNLDSTLYTQAIVLKDQIDPIAIAVSWKNTHFLAWLNLYLATIKDDGFEKQIRQTYLKK